MDILSKNQKEAERKRERKLATPANAPSRGYFSSREYFHVTLNGLKTKGLLVVYFGVGSRIFTMITLDRSEVDTVRERFVYFSICI